jgi:hypothetical protein
MIVAAPREGDPSDAYGYYVLDGPRDPEHKIAVFHLLWDGEPSCDPGVWIEGATFVHQGTAYLGVGVKYRGATSCGAPKTGLKVRFRKGARFRGLKKLNLLAGWQDRSLLREKLAWDLFREVGHPHCRAEMAAVYTRGNRFHGLFIAIDEPDADFLERNGLDRDGGLWKMNTSFLGAKHTLPGPPRFERVLAPEDGSGDQALHELEIRLNRLEGRELRDFLLASFDVESLIDYQAIQVVISNEDAYTKNTFLHRAPDGRWTLIPWDLDLSFGQRSLYEDSSHIDTHPLAGTADHPRIGSHGIRYNGLIEAVFGRRSEDFFVRALYARIRALVQKVEGARFMARLDALEASTRREAAADHAKWPRWGSATRDASEHRQHLRAYLAGRTAYLERFLASKEPTTASATRPFGPGEAPLISEGLPPRPATAYRSFQSIPLPRIVFTEVHFAPKDSPGLEFIELRSLENATVDVSGWSIPALGYVFPEGSSVPAKQPSSSRATLLRSWNGTLASSEGASSAPTRGSSPDAGRICASETEETIPARTRAIPRPSTSCRTAPRPRGRRLGETVLRASSSARSTWTTMLPRAGASRSRPRALQAADRAARLWRLCGCLWRMACDAFQHESP